uniref:MBL fold metallo-hydrolase n=1 Tax=Natronorubrum tibetense TaxID=63128 RepID=UPI001F4CB50E|nr:MBL fold metallo-hydrolase [Natronorubrum tibetense]
MHLTRLAIPVATRAPGGATNAYLLGDESAVLVDPAARTDELDRAVRTRDVEHVLVTHTHPDHVGAVDAYAAETDATVWARYGHAERFREATGVDPDRTFTPGTSIPLGDDRVRVFDAPGHAPDHVALEAGRDGPILCGDCAVREGSVVVGAVSIPTERSPRERRFRSATTAFASSTRRATRPTTSPSRPAATDRSCAVTVQSARAVSSSAHRRATCAPT